MITKLPFGLRNGKLFSIHEVEKGLDCDCICPKCNVILIARKGKVNAHHFAHYDTIDCEGAAETALHLAAKEILLSEKLLSLPGFQVFDKGGLYTSNPKQVTFDAIFTERRINDFQPDIIAYKNDRELFIEIAVTHFVDELKYKKLKKHGVATLEIDLSQLKDGFELDELKNILIDSIDNKKWIFNPKSEINRKSHKKFKVEQHHKNVEIKQEEDKELVQEENKYRRLKQSLINLGYKELKVDSFRQLLCPKKMVDVASSFTKTNVSQSISEGGFWNGEFYGNFPYGRYIYLNRNKSIIFPPDHENTRASNKEGKVQFAQLNKLLKNSRLSPSDCTNCKYFGGSNYSSQQHFDDVTVLCGYKRKTLKR
jgi:hypothetical protein